MTSTIDIAAVASILGGAAVLGAEVQDLGELERVVARGLPVEALRHTVRYTVESPTRMRAVADRLVPPATRKRRTGSALTPEESARVERLARLMALAEQVWEDHGAAQAFMARPHPLLEGPETELGARRVERILTKLEYGLPV